MTTITIELCQEDRARLDKILAALEHSSPDCKSCVQGVTTYVAAALGEQPKADEKTAEPTTTPTEAPAESRTEPQTPFVETQEETPFDEPKHFEAPEEPPKPVRVVELAEIQRKVVELSTAGKKAEAREIITAYAAKISGIPEDKRAEVLDKLNALEG
jgi:hypothetical protein